MTWPTFTPTTWRDLHAGRVLIITGEQRSLQKCCESPNNAEMRSISKAWPFHGDEMQR